jgi:hypothetical protein
VELQYSRSHGNYGRAISNGGGTNTIELAGYGGTAFIGKKIRITSGTGAGQERIITAVSAPIPKDRGVVTTGSSTAIIDASVGVMTKQWRVNQWRDYQVRIISGTLAGSVRNVIYNNNNTLTFSDVAHASVNSWWGAAFSINTSGTSLYQIESNIATVDSNWDVTPDSTSTYDILSGGIWLVTTQIAPFYNMMYYDVAADMWYRKTSTGGVFPVALGTDVSMEVIQGSSAPVFSGTVTAATGDVVTDSALTLTPGTYTNYEVRMLTGALAGQSRTITSNTATSLLLVRPFDGVPSVSDTFGVYRDVGKIYLTGNASSVIAQYDVDSDLTSCGRRFDYGVVRNATATVVGTAPFAITGIVRVSGGISDLAASPTVAGTGYVVGQVLTITTGGTGGTARITEVDINGGVTQVSLETPGTGYTTGSGKATSVIPASTGTGCTLDITTIADIATVTTAIPHKFRIGDSVSIAGAVQADYNGTKTIIGLAAVTTFAYVVTNAPTTPATFTFAQSATQLFDVSKNWVVDEHVGKLVLITNAASPNATAVIRRINSNTANSLTFSTITTAAVNSTHRYAIIHDKAFGTDESIGSLLGSSENGRGRSGVATSGTTTSLTDSSKNWPVNYWSNILPTGGPSTGRRVRIMEGTGVGAEMVIISNTATTLNFATQSFTPDQTSVYVILDSFGRITAGGTTTITDNTQNWGTNIWAGKRVRITSGTGVGNEGIINSNTQTTLTLAATVAADTTSTYAIMALSARGAGISSFNIKNSTDTTLNDRYIYMFRGGVTNELVRYDIVTEEVTPIAYFPNFDTLTTGSMYAYDGKDRIYFTKDATGRVMYYDIVTNTVENASTVPYGMSTAIIGNRMDITKTEDGLQYLYVARHSAQEWWRVLLYW